MKTENLALVVGILGIVLVIAGVVLFIGNKSGDFVTFPYAGFVSMAIGSILFAVAKKIDK